MKLVPIVLAIAFLAAGAPVGAADTTECRPIPKGKRILKLNFKPDSALVDLFNTYTMLTCKKLVLKGDLSQHRVAIDAQKEITVEELRQLVQAHAEKAKLKVEETEHTFEVSAR